MEELSAPDVAGGFDYVAVREDDSALAVSVRPTYAQIRALEHEIAKLPPVETPVTHHFAEGVYGREIFIPAGTVITGKIHRQSTLNILLSGEIHITGEDGAVRRIEAPQVFVTEPGTKKVCFAHTDARFMNVHPTKLRDVEAIEAKFIVPEEPVLRIGKESKS